MHILGNQCGRRMHEMTNSNLWKFMRNLGQIMLCLDGQGWVRLGHVKVTVKVITEGQGYFQGHAQYCSEGHPR